MSMYDSAWNELKTKQTCSLVVNRHLHARIIKAVIKRKWLDIAYKVSIEPKISHLTYQKSGNTITFHLSVVLPKTLRHLEGLSLDPYGKIKL